MGGAAPVDGGKKGKKSLDATLNLVPFIDLLSCLISFLLITAVWTQVSKVHAQTTGSLTISEPPPDNPNQTSVRVLLTPTGFEVTSGGQPQPPLPKVPVSDPAKPPPGVTPGGYDTKGLADRLIDVKKHFSEQRGVTVAAEDTVNFEDLSATIDMITSDAVALPDVSLTPATN
jgi:biopolymer transport protein ExbD